MTTDTPPPPSAPLLEVSELKKHFPVRKGLLRRTVGQVHAVDGISFSIGRGETLSVVGESGCGKSTTGRLVMKLMEPTAGAIRFDGEDVTALDVAQAQHLRRRMQIIFQDPYSSLNPRQSAGSIVAEPMVIHRTQSGTAINDRVEMLFRRVGLRADDMRKLPAAFSGGQRQRIGIARALALNPELIVCDEPVSALDVSIQAQVVNLLMDLQDEFGLSYLFIAHDLAVVHHISHRVAVMYLGRIVELADRRSLFRDPLHPYTQALLSAIPRPAPSAKRADRAVLSGDLPSPVNPPSGCRFHTRCPLAMPRCRVDDPTLREVRPGHWAACHLHDVEAS
ncbi:dipeptide ABC transporter ATP-binding protein [Terrarubrum flagellatum]|uniref:ABC transporter ATP-binding protein n=1 Tax=Terrirubrum flagellatum TaxID=2895980 RepID=UPI003144DBDA